MWQCQIWFQTYAQLYLLGKRVNKEKRSFFYLLGNFSKDSQKWISLKVLKLPKCLLSDGNITWIQLIYYSSFILTFWEERFLFNNFLHDGIINKTSLLFGYVVLFFFLIILSTACLYIKFLHEFSKRCWNY